MPFSGKPRLVQQRGDGRLLVDLDGFVVDGDLHRAPTKPASGSGAPLSSPTMASAVHGASRKPDRPWPAATSVRSSSRPTMRQVVRRHRTQTRRAFGEFVLAQRRHHRAGVVEQFTHPGHGGRGVAAVLVLGGADHHAVGARHQVHLPAVHAGADHPLRHRHTAPPPAQPQHLTLDRAHRQARPQRRARRCRWRSPDVGVAPRPDPSTGGAHCTPSRSQCAASASTTARLSTASSVSARNPCRMPWASSGSISRAARGRASPGGPARPATRRPSSGPRRRPGRRRPPAIRAR